MVVALVLGILAVGTVRWLLREPMYQGQTLTTWMVAAAGCSICDPDVIDAEKFQGVLLAMGDASLPVLLRHLRYREPSALDERLAAWDHRLPWLDWRWKRRHHLPMVALAAFEILNTNATSAIPELSRRLWAGGEAWLLVPALQSIGPASIPTLVEALDAEEIDTRVRLIHALGSLGEHAAPARPRFHQLLHDPGVPVPVRHAVASVWFESGSPEAGDIAQIESFLHDPQLHDAAALGLARAGQAGWRVLLCRLESPETNSIPLLAALTVGAELEWARYGSPLLAARGESSFDFGKVQTLYNLRLMGGSMAAREARLSNSWMVGSLTNIISRWTDDEELAVAALAILGKVEDPKGLAVECLTALVEDNRSELVASKATELLNARR